MRAEGVFDDIKEKVKEKLTAEAKRDAARKLMPVGVFLLLSGIVYVARR